MGNIVSTERPRELPLRTPAQSRRAPVSFAAVKYSEGPARQQPPRRRMTRRPPPTQLGRGSVLIAQQPSARTRGSKKEHVTKIEEKMARPVEKQYRTETQRISINGSPGAILVSKRFTIDPDELVIEHKKWSEPPKPPPAHSLPSLPDTDRRTSLEKAWPPMHVANQTDDSVLDPDLAHLDSTPRDAMPRRSWSPEELHVRRPAPPSSHSPSDIALREELAEFLNDDDQHRHQPVVGPSSPPPRIQITPATRQATRGELPSGSNAAKDAELAAERAELCSSPLDAGFFGPIELDANELGPSRDSQLTIRAASPDATVIAPWQDQPEQQKPLLADFDFSKLPRMHSLPTPPESYRPRRPLPQTPQATSAPQPTLSTPAAAPKRAMRSPYVAPTQPRPAPIQRSPTQSTNVLQSPIRNSGRVRGARAISSQRPQLIAAHELRSNKASLHDARPNEVAPTASGFFADESASDSSLPSRRRQKPLRALKRVVKVVDRSKPAVHNGNERRGLTAVEIHHWLERAS